MVKRREKEVKPSLNKKWFPVQHPSGLKKKKKKKRADWKLGKEKIPGLPSGRFFAHPAHRKRFLLKGGLRGEARVDGRCEREGNRE